MRPADYRVAVFTGADQSVKYERWPATIPSNSPYEVKLPELPREDDPSTLLVRATGSETNIQPDGTAGKDTYVDQLSPTTNFGTTAYLQIGVTNGGNIRRALVEMDIASGPTTAEKVVLRLYLETVGGSAQTIGIHRITASWVETAATYNAQPAHNLVAEDTTIVYGAGWYEWDVTAWYNAVKAGTYTNYGLMLKHTNEATLDTVRQFTSSDGSASQRPLLRITGRGAVFSEVASSAAPASGEVRCKYSRGVLGFNSADAGKSILVDFYGKGSPVAAKDVGALTRYLGSGADGELNVLSGTTTLTGTLYSYTRIYVAPGATLTISGPHTVVIGCTGDVEIYGTVTLDGKGSAGGPGGAAWQAGAPGQGFGQTGGRGGGAGSPAVTVSQTYMSPATRGCLAIALVKFLSWAQYSSRSTADAEDQGITDWYNAANSLLETYRVANDEAGLVDLLSTGNLAAGTDWPFGILRANTSAQNTALQNWLVSQDGIANYGGVLALADHLATVYDSSTTAQSAVPDGGGGGGGALNQGANGSDGAGNVSGAGGERAYIRDDGVEKFGRPMPGGGGGGGGGGASPGGAGGAGGGAMLLQVEGFLFVDANAVLTAGGANGSANNGGGGGGGCFWFRCNRRDIRVTPAVGGGNGNGRGGNGSVGWYRFEDLE